MKFLDVPHSGSMGAVTASRNRFGQYKRTRATPVNVGSGAQGIVRNRLGINAAAWRALTGAQRAGWATLGAAMSRSDSLGQSYNLNGFAAYVSINNNQLAAGNAVLADAPALVTPVGLLTAVVTLSAAAFSVAYTTTPLPVGARLFSYCSPQRSAGRSFEGDLRLLAVSAAAAVSPAVLTTAYTAKFGIPIVGNRVFMSFQIYLGGFLSGPLGMSQVVA